MTTAGTEGGGVLVVRVWFESGHGTHDFRARITSTADLDGGTVEVRAVAAPEAVIEVVREQLAAMAARRRVGGEHA